MRLCRSVAVLAVMLVAGGGRTDPVTREGGSRQRMHGYLVLQLRGTPEQMGRQHGLLLKSYVQRMIRDLILQGEASTPEEHARLIAGAMVMERYLQPESRRELKALAQAAEVDYRDLVLAQLFGDVQRASRRPYSYTPRRPSPRQGPRSGTPPGPLPVGPEWPPQPGMRCTSYAVFGAATRTGECIVGRNMDFWDHGVSSWGGVLIYFRPTRGMPFVTTSWAGIINGWTAMNVEGIVCANNSSFDGKSDSLKGLSTCFMVRKVAQYAHTVEEGVEIVRHTPRACGTNLIIAGGRPPSAAIVEYDHQDLAVRWAENGAIWADNSFIKLYQEGDRFAYYGSRYERLKELITADFGRIDRSMNFARAEGVPIRSINLHSALLFPTDLCFRVSMTQKPAADHWYRPFRLTAQGIEKLSPAEE